MSNRYNTDPVVELFEQLPRIICTPDGTYTPVDRARDFISVFSSEQGQRVLAQIHQICDPVPKIQDADKPGTMAFKNGMRRVIAEIMLCMAPKVSVTTETLGGEQ